MSASVVFDINGQTKKSIDLTYEDICYLVQQFINRQKRLPVAKDCVSKNGLPNAKIIKNILIDENLSLADFFGSFGNKRVRYFNPNDYDKYVSEYIKLSDQNGKAISMNKLMNYNLPLFRYYINNCPDSTVKTWSDFVKWCGLDVNKVYITKKLLELQKQLNRPIKRNDITRYNVGFGYAAILRFWHTLNDCQKECGLLLSERHPKKPLEYYQEKIETAKNILPDGRTYTVSEIISYCGISGHLLYTAFNRNNVNLYTYIKQLFGNILQSNSIFKNMQISDNGEQTDSNLERIFSELLNSYGLIHNIDYLRHVKYSQILGYNIEKTINCDYVLFHHYCIEIAGMIRCYSDDSWRNKVYDSEIKNRYTKKLIYKEEILKQNNIPYLFLFEDDFRSERYIHKFAKFMNSIIKDNI